MEYKTPKKPPQDKEEEERQQFKQFGLSPPPTWFKHTNQYADAIKNIRQDFSDKWNENEVTEENQILLFLYSRNYLGKLDQYHRRKEVQKFLEQGDVRRRMMLILRTEGDTDLSQNRQKHYTATCTAIYRYFEQDGAQGFMDDMSCLQYYLRNNQLHGSCFLQSACVCISYRLQASGKHIPPPDASQFIRHQFNLQQLTQYVVEDVGGDSQAIYLMLLNLFFTWDRLSAPVSSITAKHLQSERLKNAIIESLAGEGQPILVAKFSCKNFTVSRESDDHRTGYVRFTTWGEEGEFIPLAPPSDEERNLTQKHLKKKWFESCSGSFQPINVNELDKQDDVDTLLTATSTASISESPTERWSDADLDNNDNADDGDGDDLYDAVDDENFTNRALDSTDSDELQEGERNPPLHSMILLGIRQDGDEIYWFMQNSWTKMRLVEVSTSYLTASGAILMTTAKDFLELRSHTQHPVQCSPSRVAGSQGFERADCEFWESHLIGDLFI